MNELADVLTRQAEQIRAEPDLADVQRRAVRRRRRVRGLRTALATVLVVTALGALGVVVTTHRTEHDTPASPAVEIPAQSIGGAIIADATTNGSYPLTSLERSDPDAGSGSYALVVRRSDGDLGTASAVVTNPASPGSLIDGSLTMDSSTGITLSSLAVTRPDGLILVRGVDLDGEVIKQIAAATQITNGRPVLALPAAISSDYAVVAVGSVRPPVIHEVRYGCDALGEASALGAFCYTGLTTSPGFTNSLYQTGYRRGPLVQGHPSVVSSVGGGNATLAWEPQPGVIAYVGYSGTALGSEQIDALSRLAQRAEIISPTDWRQSEPQVVQQDNTW